MIGLAAVLNAGTRSDYAPLVEKIGEKHGVPAAFIHAVIRAESNYDPRAVSAKGAAGLMQLMPDTAERYGVKDIFDAADNLEGGVKYLKDLIQLYDGRRDLVLAAYNAGQAAVKKYGGVPPYPETQAYIAVVRSSYESGIVRDRAVIYKYYDAQGSVCYSTRRPGSSSAVKEKS